MKAYEENELSLPQVSEPDGIYAASMNSDAEVSPLQKPLRRVSRDELEANCVTLEELDRSLTEIIHNHFHPSR